MSYTLTERDLVELRMLLDHVQSIRGEVERVGARLNSPVAGEHESIRSTVGYVQTRLMGLAARADLAEDVVHALLARARRPPVRPGTYERDGVSR